MKLYKKYSFVGWILKLKNVTRWHLMQTIFKENNSTHSFDVAVIAHMIAIIGVEKHGRQYNPSDIAVAAIYHEASEVGVGDIPSPVKYSTPELRDNIKKLEKEVEGGLVYHSLPDYLQKYFENIVIQDNVDKDIKQIVKVADDIAAYLKTIRELSLNNLDYLQAEVNTKEKIEKHARELPEVNDFVTLHLPFCSQSVDSLSSPEGI